MQPLEALAREARALADGTPPRADGTAPPAGAGALHADETEAARLLRICNACRYCEGYCAVFPAMTRRLQFGPADVHFLAHLCHHCGACLHACQYAPPHEFAVNVPRAMARLRASSYAALAWPAAFGRLVERGGAQLAALLALAVALFIALVLAASGSLWGAPAGGDFYALVPHGLMVWMFAPVFGFALLALAIGVWRFWCLAPPRKPGAAAAAEALGHTLALTYLDGGHGAGCHNADDGWTLARRRWHHLLFYGFGACFAATAVATIYHYGLGRVAPHPFTSLPKLLGVGGGIAMLAGVLGLAALRRTRHAELLEPRTAPMDRALITLLGTVAASGLALAFLRTTPAMPLLLCLHLGAVLVFFATLPYGKFAHGAYRAAALLKWAVERRRPNPVQVGEG